MKLPTWVRRTHKWIGLVIGVQALLWMASGVYMTIVPLDVIHGDHLVDLHEPVLSPAGSRIDTDALQQRNPGVESIRLKTLLGREVYELRAKGKSQLVDARDGAPLGPLTREQASAQALELYHGDGSVRDVEWVIEAPLEVARRPVPMWAVHFDDRGQTTLYLSPQSGDLLARRHTLWRWFDFLWMLHIMDYDQRTDVNNLLLRTASALGLAFALSGAWLVYFSFKRRAAP